MKVLLASAEVAPFAKVGGLADVAGSLPKALHERGVDIRVIMPKYRGVTAPGQPLRRRLESVIVPMPSFVSGCALDESTLPGTEIPIYFVEHNHYFDRDSVYGPGGGFPDNFERLVFFCRAVLASFEGLGWEPDIIHLNDWHTTLIAPYVVTWDLPYGTVFTAHNLGPNYQGRHPWYFITQAGLDQGDRRVRECLRDEQLNLARVGFVFSDMINTVSKGYAKEVQSPEFGAGIDDLAVARADDMTGIVNGIDYDLWNPATDRSLPANFSADNLAGKQVCKSAAQQEFGLPVDPAAPLITMVTRLDDQKGLDLLHDVVDEVAQEAQLAILGTGDPRYEQFLAQVSRRLPNVKARLMFSNQLAKLLYAGGDMFLMPSRYEPCGLGQMIALAYGNIPVVRATGGLADTIKEKGKTPNGFRFDAYDAGEMLTAIRRALAAYAEPDTWARLVQNAFGCNFSWDASAKQYVTLYKKALARAKAR
ncbi:MAG: glycogen synthase [Armatimonadetes bacterium]|nr:glycogen synthase [Armatimonadota bacterium]